MVREGERGGSLQERLRPTLRGSQIAVSWNMELVRGSPKRIPGFYPDAAAFLHRAVVHGALTMSVLDTELYWPFFFFLRRQGFFLEFRLTANYRSLASASRNIFHQICVCNFVFLFRLAVVGTEPRMFKHIKQPLSRLPSLVLEALKLLYTPLAFYSCGK